MTSWSISLDLSLLKSKCKLDFQMYLSHYSKAMNYTIIIISGLKE